MKRKFLTNLILLTGLNLLVKPFWIFGIDRTVQVLVGESEYGLYFSLFNLSFLLNIILDLGITNFNNCDIARHKHLLSKYFSNIFGLKLILTLFYIVICLSIGLILKYNQRQFYLLLILVINQILSSFILYLRSNLNALHLFKTDSILSVLDRIIMIILCSILIWGNISKSHFQIEWFAYTQTISYFIDFIIAFILVLAKSEYFHLNFQFSYILIILKNSYPFALMVLLMSSYTYIDAIMLERLLPDGTFQAGLYAQSFRIYYAFSMFALLFANLLLPIFSRMLKNKENINDLTQFSFYLLIVPATILIVASVIFSDNIITLLYPGSLSQSSLIFSIIMLGFLPVCSNYIYGTLLTANNNLKQINIMAFTSAIVNIIANLILIPLYKALGSAIALFITQLYSAIYQYILSYKLIHIDFSSKKLFKMIVFIVLLILLGIFTNIYISNWYLGIFVFFIISIIISMILKLFSPKYLLTIIKNN